MKATALLLLALSFAAPALAQDAAKQPGNVHEEGDTLPLTPARHLRFDESEGTWVSLDVSPDGRKIVFELLGDIYAMPLAGGEARCIICGLPFDSQPAYSPDGTMLAFVSDRSGNENLWVARSDGSAPHQISRLDDNSVFISPAWSADGKSIFLSRFKPDLNAFELFRYQVSDGSMEQITHAKSAADTPKEFRQSALGAAVSPDGQYLYFEAKTGYGFDDDNTFPLWHIVRHNLKTGQEETVVNAQGSAFRPGLSPDGRKLVYATRFRGQTGLRIRDLQTDADDWLLYPVQRDDQEASASRDLLPRYAFTPDSASLILNYDGRIHKLDLHSRHVEPINFQAHIDLPMGPYLRQDIREETGPVRARLIQTPSESPDGKRLVFSALAHVYVMSMADRTAHRLTSSDAPEFDPSWSSDGRLITYVTWTRAGGDIWVANADGTGQPKRLTDHSDFYRYPVFAADDGTVYALRSSNYEHNHRYMEFGNMQSDAIELSAEGGPAKVLASGTLNNIPQLTTKAGSLYLNFSDGLYEVPLDGSPKHRVLHVTGPTWYFVDGTAAADALRISPDGNWALAQITQQLYLIKIPSPGEELSVELARPSPYEARITATGADFFAWADGGKTITWSVGSRYFRQPLDSVTLGKIDPPIEPDTARKGVQSVDIKVEIPRDIPRGTIVLRNATALTMRGDEVISRADIVIVDNHIAAIGPVGSVVVPPGATIRDLTGKFVLPGFTDTHFHWADVRRGELDLQSWGFLATLAYGITSGLDPSPLSIDMLAYEDLLDAGLMTGTRVHSTGPAVFSFNDFQSGRQAFNVISRYPELYRTRNLKEYRTGNRRQREWVLEATDKLHIQATTEGALDMKLDMTQIQDGFPGNEHAYSAVPIADDIVQLFARSGVSYTPTLQISNGGLAAEEFYYTTQNPQDAIQNDPKLRHFEPGFFLDQKTERVHWALPGEYAFPQVAAGASKIQRAGGLVGVGSHGNFPGIGFHFEMQALASGGMTPMEVLHAATIGSIKTIGRQSEFGTLEPGKYADLIVLDKDPLLDIRNTLSIASVMKNGRLYDAATLNEVWPRQRALPPLWFQGDDANLKGAEGDR